MKRVLLAIAAVFVLQTADVNPAGRRELGNKAARTFDIEYVADRGTRDEKIAFLRAQGEETLENMTLNELNGLLAKYLAEYYSDASTLEESGDEDGEKSELDAIVAAKKARMEECGPLTKERLADLRLFREQIKFLLENNAMPGDRLLAVDLEQYCAKVKRDMTTPPRTQKRDTYTKQPEETAADASNTKKRRRSTSNDATGPDVFSKMRDRALAIAKQAAQSEFAKKATQTAQAASRRACDWFTTIFYPQQLELDQPTIEAQPERPTQQSVQLKDDDID